LFDPKDANLIIKRYKLRVTGKEGRTVETSIPREVVEREARRQGLTLTEALKKLVAVWRYDSFAGLFLCFEPVDQGSETP
jgi:hypothetical protein